MRLTALAAEFGAVWRHHSVSLAVFRSAQNRLGGDQSRGHPGVGGRFLVESQLLIVQIQSRQRESADFPRHFTQNRAERPVIRDELVAHTGARPSRRLDGDGIKASIAPREVRCRRLRMINATHSRERNPSESDRDIRYLLLVLAILPHYPHI